MFWAILFLFPFVKATVLSLELCDCTNGCRNMDVVASIPYEFTYVKKTLTVPNEYDYICYLEVAGKLVFVSSPGVDIDCSLSDITISGTHTSLVNYSPNTCMYNGTFTDAFLSLRNLVTTVGSYPGYTIYYQDIIPTNRQLYGWCEGNLACDWGVGITIGLLGLSLALFVSNQYMRKFFGKKKTIHSSGKLL